MERIDCSCKYDRKIPMNVESKATRLWLCYCKSIHIKTFHLSWWAFYISFFGWFGTANLSHWIDKSIDLTTADKTYAAGCAVASTVLFRVLVGEYCDSVGPRKLYAILLVISSIPVLLMGLVTERYGYIIIHFFIGISGASFVITQYHCTNMFAGSIVGTSNATSAGWGNIGGASANFFMPLLLKLIVIIFNISGKKAWRFTFIIPAVLNILTAIVYYIVTTDTPLGNYSDLDENNKNNKKNKESNNGGSKKGIKKSPSSPKSRSMPSCIEPNPYVSPENDSDDSDDMQPELYKTQSKENNTTTTEIATKNTKTPKPKIAKISKKENETKSPFMKALSDSRVIILSIQYAASFGIELTILRFTVTYLQYKFDMSVELSGLMVLLYGLVNIFARSIGGFGGDYISIKKEYGLKGRVYWIFVTTLLEGIFLILFSIGTFNVYYTIIMLLLFSLFVKIAQGATFCVTPFILPEMQGSVAGIIGGGGNFGAAIFALGLFRFVPDTLGYVWAHSILSIFVIITSFLCLLIKFDKNAEKTASKTSLTNRSFRMDTGMLREFNDPNDSDDDDNDNENENDQSPTVDSKTKLQRNIVPVTTPDDDENYELELNEMENQN